MLSVAADANGVGCRSLCKHSVAGRVCGWTHLEGAAAVEKLLLLDVCKEVKLLLLDGCKVGCRSLCKHSVTGRVCGAVEKLLLLDVCKEVKLLLLDVCKNVVRRLSAARSGRQL